MNNKYKKISTLLLAATISASVSSAYAFTREQMIPRETIIVTVEENLMENSMEKVNYFSVEGIIKEIEERAGYISLFVELAGGDRDGEAFINISDELLIINEATKEKLDKQTLEKGMTVNAFIDKNRPMLMIYPPIYNPDLVVVRNSEEFSSLKYDYFNEDLISADGFLKLNVAEDTSIVNQYGQKLSQEDLYNKELVVLYTISTKSIPAQTNPDKIVVFAGNADETSEVELDTIFYEDSYNRQDELMLPVRKFAEALGYEVSWVEESESVILLKEDMRLSLSIGKQDFDFNGEQKRFEAAPELKEGRTYVPHSFIEMLK